MGVTARTSAEKIVKTGVTTSGGESTASARTPETPASAAPVTNLLRDPGETRRVIVPALAPISLAETTDGVVTVVLKAKNIEIVLQNPHLQPDQPH